MRISDWSSDVCSSDLPYRWPTTITPIAASDSARVSPWQKPQVAAEGAKAIGQRTPALWHCARRARALPKRQSWPIATAAQSSEYGRRIAPPRCKNPALSEITVSGNADCPFCSASRRWQLPPAVPCPRQRTASQGKSGGAATGFRSEEHPSELQSLMRISYAVFCLKKKIYQVIICYIKYY